MCDRHGQHYSAFDHIESRSKDGVASLGAWEVFLAQFAQTVLVAVTEWPAKSSELLIRRHVLHVSVVVELKIDTGVRRWANLDRVASSFILDNSTTKMWVLVYVAGEATFAVFVELSGVGVWF